MTNLMTDNILTLTGLSKSFARSGGENFVVNDVNLSLQRNSIFGLVGESGSGKTTIGRLSLRFTDATAGRIIFNGKDITDHKGSQLSNFRRDAQMVFQNPYGSFNPKKRLRVALRDYARLLGIHKNDIDDNIAARLEQTALPTSILQSLPAELSGGQLQRLAIARALLCDPLFLFADEPVSALDVSVQAQILKLLVELHSKRQMTILFVSHDLAVVETICDTVAVIYRGRIVEQAATEILFKNMLHPYTSLLLCSRPKEHPSKVLDCGLKDIGTMRMPMGESVATQTTSDGCAFAPICPMKTERCMCAIPQLSEIEPGHLCACHEVF
ncbi:MAG: ABC transporter ATP-binding protein [Coriobacteriales bacterium]|jgi:oligopeptide/dipeptide ABC transporter ATP-binding protein|nr:ABC transporter ATP-binding protein [Coriobacteriales bacterium]